MTFFIAFDCLKLIRLDKDLLYVHVKFIYWIQLFVLLMYVQRVHSKMVSSGSFDKAWKFRLKWKMLLIWISQKSLTGKINLVFWAFMQQNFFEHHFWILKYKNWITTNCSYKIVQFSFFSFLKRWFYEKTSNSKHVELCK